jgi:PTS system galactitol-specific IIB component
MKRGRTMKKIRVLVACGAGIATSTVVMKKVEDLFKTNHVLVDITQIKIAEAAAKQDDADLLISTTMLPTSYRIPAIKAMAFLTGIGTEKVEQEIMDAVNKINGN